jgi:hypothetical protein
MNLEHPPGPPMALGNMRELVACLNDAHRRTAPNRRACLKRTKTDPRVANDGAYGAEPYV